MSILSKVKGAVQKLASSKVMTGIKNVATKVVGNALGVGGSGFLTNTGVKKVSATPVKQVAGQMTMAPKPMSMGTSPSSVNMSMGTSPSSSKLMSMVSPVSRTTASSPVSAPILSKATAPTRLDQVTATAGTPSPNISSPTNYGTNTMAMSADANASVAGQVEDARMKLVEEEQARALAASQSEKEQKTGLLQDIFGKTQTRQEELEQAREELGIDMRARLQEQQADAAEYNSMAATLGQLEAAKNSQILQTNDFLGSRNFLNNMVGKIQRNAAPPIYELNAKMSAKAAMMEAKAKNWAEADKLAAQAVEYAMADQKDYLDQMGQFMQVNDELFKNTESTYSTAYKAKYDILTDQYNQQMQDKKWMIEMGLENNIKVDPIKDTPQTVANRIITSGGTLTSRLQRQQLANAQLDYNLKKSGGNEAPTGGTSSDDVVSQFNEENKIKMLDSLMKNNGGVGLATSAGTLRGAPVPFLFKNKINDWRANIISIASKLTMDNLVKLKGEGATFGALSDPERIAIGQAASKIVSAMSPFTDKKGNLIGKMKMSEKAVLDELKVIQDGYKMNFKRKYGVDYDTYKESNAPVDNENFFNNVDNSLLLNNTSYIPGGVEL